MCTFSHVYCTQHCKTAIIVIIINNAIVNNCNIENEEDLTESATKMTLS